MKGFIWLFSWFLIAGCASSYKGQNAVKKSKVVFSGGVYKGKKWSEDLVFHRTSFFKGANLHYDILIARLPSDSPFMAWMGSSKNTAQNCARFFITMLYKGRTAPFSHASVMEQMTAPKRLPLDALDFKIHLSQHYLFNEYNFKGHVVRGLCDNSMGQLSEIKVFIPGFEETNVL